MRGQAIFFLLLLLIPLQTLRKIQKPIKFKALKSQALRKTNTREPSTMRRQDCQAGAARAAAETYLNELDPGWREASARRHPVT